MFCGHVSTMVLREINRSSAQAWHLVGKMICCIRAIVLAEIQYLWWMDNETETPGIRPR